MLAQGSAIQTAESSSRGRELQRAWLWLRARLALSPELRQVFKRSLQASAAAYALSRIVRTLRPSLPTTHPGTAAWRKLCANPVIPPHEFESRFIGRSELAAEGPWDFIVVGSGSAGCVLASRLAAHEGVRVLLVEAGGEAQNAAAVATPNRCWELYRSEVDWSFRSAPQQQLFPEGRTVSLERGLSLGGSSSINYLMWVRGQRQDFERWATQMGCGEAWSYERVAPHFTQVERVTRLGTTLSQQRGHDGPVGISTVHPLPKEIAAFLEACKAEGLNTSKDYNSWSQDGAGPTQFSVMNGRRADAFTAFVEPVLHSRPNLRVVSEVFVRRVLFDENLRAQGVEVELNDGSVLPLRASREVVLAAGAIGSPHVLMHSGVGDREELAALGIPVLAHVPAVGKHLQDHPGVGLACQLAEPFDGIFLTSSGLNGVGFAHSPTDRAIAEEEGYERGPDCELTCLSRIVPLVTKKMATEGLHGVLMAAMGVDASQRPMLWRAVSAVGVALGGLDQTQQAMSNLIFLGGQLNHPESRGTVRLRSKDPHVPPVIDPNYLSDPRDLEKLKFLVLKARDLLRRPSMQQLVTSVGFPGAYPYRPIETVFDDVSEEQLEYHVRSGATTTWHYSCTVRMGPADDDSCACDPRLRVKGVTGLRCADASIMPFVNSANTNAVCMVIGSIAASFIAEDHGLVGAAVQQSGLPSRL